MIYSFTYIRHQTSLHKISFVLKFRRGENMDLNKLEEDSNGIVVQPNSGFVTTYNSFIRNPNISSNAPIYYLIIDL